MKAKQNNNDGNGFKLIISLPKEYKAKVAVYRLVTGGTVQDFLAPLIMKQIDASTKDYEAVLNLITSKK